MCGILVEDRLNIKKTHFIIYFNEQSNLTFKILKQNGAEPW